MDCGQLNDEEMTLASGCFLFEGADRGVVLRALADSRCELAEYGRGEVIFDENSYRHSLGLVLSGEVKVSDCVSGQRYLMNVIAPGGVFGAAAIFSPGGDYVTKLRAGKRCRVAFFSQPLMEEYMRENPVLAKNYVVFLSGRIRFLNAKIRGLLSVSAGSSVAGYLISNMSDGESGLFVDCGSLSALAKRLNLGRTSLYRAFASLEASGIIKKDGQRVEILDLNALSSVK